MEPDIFRYCLLLVFVFTIACVPFSLWHIFRSLVSKRQKWWVCLLINQFTMQVFPFFGNQMASWEKAVRQTARTHTELFSLWAGTEARVKMRRFKEAIASILKHELLRDTRQICQKLLQNSEFLYSGCFLNQSIYQCWWFQSLGEIFRS